MQRVTITLPDELLDALTASGEELSRTAVEALSLEAYRNRKISAAQLRHLLGFQTRMEVDAFLKEHGVELEYGLEDLERDRKTHNQLGL
jgi:Uncharacterised protein family (UPF0175)